MKQGPTKSGVWSATQGTITLRFEDSNHAALPELHSKGKLMYWLSMYRNLVRLTGLISSHLDTKKQSAVM